MKRGWLRGGLLVLAVSALTVGLWALLVPRSFYDDFPLPGRAWVSTLGPYNEHLVRDVGALNLARRTSSSGGCAARTAPRADLPRRVPRLRGAALHFSCQPGSRFSPRGQHREPHHPGARRPAPAPSPSSGWPARRETNNGKDHAEEVDDDTNRGCIRARG